MLKSPAPESKHPLKYYFILLRSHHYKVKAFFYRYFASHAMLRRHFVLAFLKMSRDKKLQDFWRFCTTWPSLCQGLLPTIRHFENRHWSSILSPPKHWIVVFLSILKPKAVIYPCSDWNQDHGSFLIWPANAPLAGENMHSEGPQAN